MVLRGVLTPAEVEACRAELESFYAFHSKDKKPAEQVAEAAPPPPSSGCTVDTPRPLGLMAVLAFVLLGFARRRRAPARR